MPRLAPRALRYQIARFCLWEGETGEEYRYRIAPAGLERAAAQGLRPRQLMGLLRRHVDADAFPPALVQGLERWEAAGTQASVENAVLLRLAHPGILEALKKTRAARFIQEEISPTLVRAAPRHAGEGAGSAQRNRLPGGFPPRGIMHQRVDYDATKIAVALVETILARYPDPDTIPYQPWCYVQGYVLAGFEKMWRSTGDPRYLAYVRQIRRPACECGWQHSRFQRRQPR